MDGLLSGTPTAQAVADPAHRAEAERIFLLDGGTLSREAEGA